MSEHTFCYVVFLDPTYKAGWIERKELPVNKDALHVGCGVVVGENDKSITIALAEEAYDKNSSVMHPQLLPKDCIIKLFKFTEEIFDELSKPGIKKVLKNQVRREVDYDIDEYNT